VNASDEEIFCLLLGTIELAITRVWVLQQMLDHHQVPNWREDSLVVEVDIAADVRRKLQPLFDAMLGKPAQVPQSIGVADWQEQVRRLIDGAFDPGDKP
jgi:hypothetical protein